MPDVDTLSFAVSEAKHAEARNDALVYLETIRKSNEQPDLQHSDVQVVRRRCRQRHRRYGAARTGRSDRHVHARLFRPHALGAGQRHRESPAQRAVPRAGRARRAPSAEGLITLDGSPLSERAIEPGLSLAQSLQRRRDVAALVPHVVDRRETRRTRTRPQPPDARRSDRAKRRTICAPDRTPRPNRVW